MSEIFIGKYLGVFKTSYSELHLKFKSENNKEILIPENKANINFEFGKQYIIEPKFEFKLEN